MKTFKRGIFFYAIVLFAICSLTAQDKQPTMFTTHTDHVNFDKIMEYEGIIKELNENLAKHNINGTSWTAISLMDGRYIFASPISNMAELDKNPLGDLFEKMGKEAAGNLFERMNKCYDSHSDAIIHHIPELSYMPEGYSIDGKNFREYHIMYYSPKNSKAIGDAMEGVKELFESKGIKNGYNMYHSGFGSERGYYMVSIAGEDQIDIASRGKENDEAFGPEGQAIFYEVIKLTSDYEKVEGRVRPDLSYFPKE